MRIVLTIGRNPKSVQYIEAYLKATQLFQNYSDEVNQPEFTEIVELDLGTVLPCVSGPKRPQDKVSVSDLKTEFRKCLVTKIGFNVSQSYCYFRKIRYFNRSTYVEGFWTKR